MIPLLRDLSVLKVGSSRYNDYHNFLDDIIEDMR